MTPAQPSADLARIGEHALLRVLNTQLSLPATVCGLEGGCTSPTVAELITSQVPLTGQGLSAMVRVRLPVGFIAHAVERLTGLEGDSEEGTALQEDTAGELANMVAGRVAAELAASGYPCCLGTPSTVPNAALPAATGPGVDYERVSLLCEGHVLWLEIECRHEAS